MFSSSNFDIEHPENSSENGGEDDGFLGYVHDGDEMMIDSEFGQNADEAIIREEAESNPEFAKSTLEKTILIDDSLEADVFRDEQEQLSPLKQSPKLFASAGLSPFKRLSFGRKTEPEEPSNDKGPPKPIRINLTDLSDPLLPPKQKFVQDEFFGVYCLVSKSPEKFYKNRCYIGFTIDPNRRIRQHNAGKQAGGAKKTDSRGPWDMVCIIHGFPNAIAALRFEWAWQNPKKSKRLKGLMLNKSRKESPFGFCFRIVCHMLNSKPWREFALTFRWLIQDYELPFPLDLDLPPHMKVAYGKVQKVNVAVPVELHEYVAIRDCHICRKSIAGISQLLRCPATEICGVHFHVRCLAEHCLKAQGLLLQRLVPIQGLCPKCSVYFLWGDLIRDQRTLLLVDESKPESEGIRIAGGLIPRRVMKN